MQCVDNPKKFRAKVTTKISQHLKGNKIISKNLEISIYNHSIRRANDMKLVKKWTNKFFVQLYLNRLFSIYSNLNNEEFQKLLVTGKIKPTEYVDLTHQTMQPSKWEEALQKKKIRDENKYNPVLAASTEDFTCGRCKSTKCIHFQAQTRSADESMTTYVTCINCGENWKC